MKTKIILPILILILLPVSGSLSYAEDAPAKPSNNSGSTGGNGARSQSINLDGDTIEGLNKRPLDSVSQISEGNRKKNRPHLYHKRSDYHQENLQELRDLRYVQ